MNLFKRTGKIALGSRLRQMTTRITDDSAKIYELYGIDFSPKWFPVFFVVGQDGEKTITEIATEIQHSQPSVSKLVREMTKAGIVEDNRDSLDKRRNVVALTDQGKDIAKHLLAPYADVEAAIEALISQARHNLWEALEEWEYLLDQQSLLARVQEQKKLREGKNVQIINYSDQYQAAFKALNEEWISTYFEMEEADYKALDNPKGYILDHGGKIFVAIIDGQPVGVCALIKMTGSEYDYELAKMAVSPRSQGKNIGWLLGQAAVQAAKDAGGRTIYLESNTALKPAINLYQKLGFKKVIASFASYARCNIQMVLNL